MTLIPLCYILFYIFFIFYIHVDACPGQNVEWTEMNSYHGYFTNDTHLDILYDIWTIERCRDLCEINDNCMAVKFDKGSGICILTDGHLMKVDEGSGTYGYYPDWVYHSYKCVEGKLTYKTSLIFMSFYFSFERLEFVFSFYITSHILL